MGSKNTVEVKAEVYQLIKEELQKEKNIKRLEKISEKVQKIFSKLEVDKLISDFLNNDFVKSKYQLVKEDISDLEEVLKVELKKYQSNFSQDNILDAFSVTVLLYLLENFAEKYEKGQLSAKEVGEAVSLILKRYEKANKNDIEYEIANFFHNVVISWKAMREAGQEEVEEKSKEGNVGSDKKENAELEKLKEENKLLKEAYARMKNDYASLRRRTEEERKRFKEQAEMDLLRELLDIVDDFERALSQIEKSENQEMFRGFVIIANKLNGILERKGLKKIGKVGEEFDPNFHEVMDVREGEEKDKIIDVIRNGYLYKDKLLRPAGVIVSKVVEKEE